MKITKIVSVLFAALAFSAGAFAQQPIKVGIGIAQTGPLGGGGKAALLALQIWRDDVNARLN